MYCSVNLAYVLKRFKEKPVAEEQGAAEEKDDGNSNVENERAEGASGAEDSAVFPGQQAQGGNAATKEQGEAEEKNDESGNAENEGNEGAGGAEDSGVLPSQQAQGGNASVRRKSQVLMTGLQTGLQNLGSFLSGGDADSVGNNEKNSEGKD